MINKEDFHILLQTLIHHYWINTLFRWNQTDLKQEKEQTYQLTDSLRNKPRRIRRRLTSKSKKKLVAIIAKKHKYCPNIYMEYYEKKDFQSQPSLSLFFKKKYFKDDSNFLNEIDKINTKAKTALPKFKFKQLVNIILKGTKG